jgi:hypothetical protein
MILTLSSLLTRLQLNFRASLLGKHANSRRSEGTQTSSQQPSNGNSTLSRVLSQTRRQPQPAQQRAEVPSPAEVLQEKKPVRARVPAVTSKARTTAPERKDARRNRRKYPRWVFCVKFVPYGLTQNFWMHSSMRQRPH